MQRCTGAKRTPEQARRRGMASGRESRNAQIDIRYKVLVISFLTQNPNPKTRLLTPVSCPSYSRKLQLKLNLDPVISARHGVVFDDLVLGVSEIVDIQLDPNFAFDILFGVEYSELFTNADGVIYIT
ncbi:MAG: hypothetical protein H6Q25_709 [Bacteroidetes bacterium]|nr:hypothetical protein [Bacteroidota bacterium]